MRGTSPVKNTATKIKLHHVPIYDCRIVFGVYDKRDEINDALGPWLGDVDVKNNIGTTFNRGRTFAIVLERRELCHELIAHEVFHATHRIMEGIGMSRMHPTGHEPYAYLCGYLTQLMYQDLKLWRERVSTTNTFDPNQRDFTRKKRKRK